MLRSWRASWRVSVVRRLLLGGERWLRLKEESQMATLVAVVAKLSCPVFSPENQGVRKNGGPHEIVDTLLCFEYRCQKVY